MGIMNKHALIKRVKDVSNLSLEESEQVIEIFENTNFLKKQNKVTIINELCVKINLNKDRCEEIYNIVIMIIKNEIKNKFKHPFKSSKI